jgi:hypothetical protein
LEHDGLVIHEPSKAQRVAVVKPYLLLYAFGGAADIWSTRGLPPFNDRSPAGPVVGPVLSSLAFASADALLQSKGHHGWAKVLRIGYGIGTVVLVFHNIGYRDALHQR